METEWPTPERAGTGVTAPPRPADARRPVQVIHLMALVAAVALSIVLVPDLMKALMSIDSKSWWNGRTYVMNVTTLTLAVWSPILAALALAENGSRSDVRSYGTGAVFAASVAVILLAARSAVGAVPFGVGSKQGFATGVQAFLWQAPPTASAAVVAVWLVLAWTGAGRRPKGWLEYLGLALGVSWVVWCYTCPLLLLLNTPWLNDRLPL